MNKGIFTISIDYEFAWGIADQNLSNKKELIKKEVEIIQRLIRVFEKYNIPATWAIVSHLLKRGLDNYPKPLNYKKKIDWFKQYPNKEKEQNILWYDSENLIFKIKNSAVHHQIASHSYAHIIYGEKGVNPKAIQYDLKKAQHIHKQNNLDFDTFIFPRNKVAFLDELKKMGIKIYRGNSKRYWNYLPNPFNRAFHLIDYFLPFSFTILPIKEKNGLINIPDSMLLISRCGLRKIIPSFCINKKAQNGLIKASSKKEIFHLWFHPSNFICDTENQFQILENILKKATKLREEGKIKITTLNKIDF